MLVSRHTWITKRGRRNELVEWFRLPGHLDWKSFSEELRPRTSRLYTARTGTFDSVALELEFDSLEHYGKFYEELSRQNASPERRSLMQTFNEITEPGGAQQELWNLEDATS